MTLSLIQRGPQVRGACVVSTAQSKQTFRCTGTIQTPVDISTELRGGDATVAMHLHLDDASTMLARIDSAGFPVRALRLQRDASA
jgi:hypothetical protein